MNNLILVAEHDGHRFEIIEGRGEGFYLFRYSDLKGQKNTHDYLQDDIEMAKDCAGEEFGVPRDGWRDAVPAEQPAFKQAKHH